VEAKLDIREEVRIPRTAVFTVGSSGLLGDRFVDVHLPAGFDSADTFKAGERIAGTRAGGLEELTSKGGAVMDQLAEELEHIQIMTSRLSEGLLHERNLKNIEATFANLREATEKFKVTSQNLEQVVAKAGETIESANTTMKTADGAAADLRSTIADLHKTLDAATKTIDNAAVLVKKASDGGGPLGALIADQKMAEDLKSFVTNLRRSGVLFYRDRPLASPAPGARR
jgi:phospholipid/cholesterol/gamma-HCH transport system substrate-binding protein